MDRPENKPRIPAKPQVKSENKSLRIAAYLVLAHGLLLITLSWNFSENIHYVAGQTAGRMFWIVIVMWALIKTVETGWAVSLLYITIMLAVQALEVVNLWSEPSIPVEAKVGETLAVVLINSLLVVALGFLVKRESRDAFKKQRNPANKKTEWLHGLSAIVRTLLAVILTSLIFAYIVISDNAFSALVLAISFCIGGWASCYYNWIKLNNGIEKGMYEAPPGEDWAIVFSSILLPILFSIFLSAIYVFVCDMAAIAGLIFQPTKTALIVMGFIIGALLFAWIFWGGIKRINK